MSFKDFHIGNLKIGKWIIGWFPAHPKTQDISLVEAVDKTTAFLDKALVYLTSPMVVYLEMVIPDNWKALVDKAILAIPDIKEHIVGISKIEDIPEKLKDVQFSGDEKQDQLYHTIVADCALIFSDGSISVNDLGVLISLINEIF